MLQKRSLHRRRENVQRQLSLWPEEERLNVWEGLDPEEGRTVIALWARLIARAVRPDDTHEKDVEGV
jgi:hypothetical protein